jgi:BirA family biotin operon repressor/biotin-[acetyl-CoA-carboxylase] ligase
VIKFFEEFETLYDDFINSRNLKKTIEICKRQSLLLNEKVRLITKKETRTVTVKDINEQGELLVLNEKEELEAVFYGEVSIRGLYDYVD